jgi:hypothetical protein
MTKKKLNITALNNRLGKLAKKYGCKSWSVHLQVSTSYHNNDKDPYHYNHPSFSLFIHETVGVSYPGFSFCHAENVELAFNNMECQLKSYYEDNEKYDKIEVEHNTEVIQ